MGIEHAKDSEAADLKEFWQVGQPILRPTTILRTFPATTMSKSALRFSRQPWRRLRRSKRSDKPCCAPLPFTSAWMNFTSMTGFEEETPSCVPFVPTHHNRTGFGRSSRSA